MDRINIQTSESPEIHIIHVEGNLRIKGWDRNELRADSDESDSLTVQSNENRVIIECKSGCMIRVPVEGSIKIDLVDSELMLKSIECPITIGKVTGQIMAKSVGPINIQKAQSNLIARNVEGGLICESISGNANLQDVEGPINIKNVHGNLVIKGYSSGLNVAAHGNCTLRLDPEIGAEYQVDTQGNISCRLSPNSYESIVLRSDSEKIHVNLGGESETHHSKEFKMGTGDGEGFIHLNANGVIDLTIPTHDEVDWAYEFDLGEDISSMADDISQIVSEQIEAQLETLSENLNSLTSNLSNIGPFTSERNKEKLEAKRMKLERKLARVERKTADKARMANRRASAAARRFSYQRSSSEPINDSERQKVLEMLQNKQISVQEAEILLAALEGREPELPSKDV